MINKKFVESLYFNRNYSIEAIARLTKYSKKQIALIIESYNQKLEGNKRNFKINS